ncbi:hypothetical protein NDU88_009511 [Pleurodeles waltl]|uniref:Uncharacterized protein n=1 Tax=Pleurodeles waltl TaxID=8319 RepID=A0AAV7P285_PLEWA|nr:hypothetical protein NDU88_009511 [Pleurodeles waltl]
MKGRLLWSGSKRSTYTLTVLLNGIERTALVNSGHSQSVVRQNLVLPGQGTPQSQVLLACVHGDQRPYPVATVHLNWKGEDETITVGVIPNLGEDLILGTDYVDFTSLQEKAGQERIHNAWWEEAPFGVSEEDTKLQRIKLSRKQKREHRRNHHRHDDPNPSPAIVRTITGDLRQCQHEDITRKHAWHQALHPDEHVRSLRSRKAGPAPGTAGSRWEEKPASRREAARHGGAGESSAYGDDEEDEEKAGRGTESMRPGWRNKNNPSHASGEAWHTQVRVSHREPGHKKGGTQGRRRGNKVQGRQGGG